MGSAAFEMRASLARLAGDLKAGEAQVQASADRAEKAAVISVRADATQAVGAIQKAESDLKASLAKIASEATATGSQLGSTLASGGAKASNALKVVGQEGAKAATLNRVQMLELTHVAKSLFDEIAAGANPLRALAVEGGRIGEVAAQSSGGLLGLGRTLVSLVAPFALGIAAIGGLVAVVGGATLAFLGFEKSQRDVQTTLGGLGTLMFSLRYVLSGRGQGKHSREKC